MDERRENTPSVPYYAFESVVSVYERHNKRLFIALVLAIVLFFVSNAMWLYVWNQYNYVDETYSDDYVQTGGIPYHLGPHDREGGSPGTYGVFFRPCADNPEIR